MSTNSDQPQANEPAPEESFDELTGVYGFFRKYQKLLLYTAGLFTLLTFSITGSLQSLVGGVFNKDVERGSIEVSGVRAQLASEDYDYGSMIARSFGRLPAGVLLPIVMRRLRSKLKDRQRGKGKGVQEKAWGHELE